MAMLKSPKARTSKDGGKYLIIPMRHGTPGAVTMKPMPQEIYEEAKKLSSSKVARINGKLITNWKGGLSSSIQFGRRSKINAEDRPYAPYTWKSSEYAGMKKMGNKGHTSYMTFRIVSSKTPPSSQAWAQPAVKPRPVAEASAKQSLPQVIRYVRDGILGDFGGR
jgi:hypothetical protein